MAAQRILETIRLGCNVVDYDDRGRRGIAGRGPPAILLVDPSLVDRRLDRAARTRQGYELGFDPDTVVERVVGAAREQRLEIEPL